ncbi:MAG: zinc-ribbon domain-containing protein [Candidatus Hodarchaeales archaeon]|jgi:uncharacterized membrane protein YvbJ
MQFKSEMCPHCGSKLIDGSNVCLECGKKINDVKNSEFYQNHQNIHERSSIQHLPKKISNTSMDSNFSRFNPLVGLIIVLFPVFSFIFYFYYRKRSSKVATQVLLLGSFVFFVINSILLYYVMVLGS